MLKYFSLVAEHRCRAVGLALSAASGDVSLHNFTASTEVGVAGLLGTAISKYELSLALVQACERNVVVFSSDRCLISTAPLGSVQVGCATLLIVSRIDVLGQSKDSCRTLYVTPLSERIA